MEKQQKTNLTVILILMIITGLIIYFMYMKPEGFFTSTSANPTNPTSTYSTQTTPTTTNNPNAVSITHKKRHRNRNDESELQNDQLK